MKATASDLKTHSKKLIDSVMLNGEEIIITYRGKPCIKLVPYNESKDHKKHKNELFGMWKDREETKDVNTFARELRKGRL